MGLQDRYKALASGGSPAPGAASAAPSTPPAATSTPAVSSPAASSSRVAATAATTTPTPARRDLTALRQRLAGGGGGVNPPEAAAAVKDDMLEPNTRETPDGGAEMLPNHPDFEKGKPAATATTAEGGAPAKRKRRTKAEMEAARAAEAAAAAPSAKPSEPVPSAEVLSRGIDTPEYRSELAAAVAETEGHKILTDDVRTCIESDAVEYYLRNLSLEGAIQLVRERMPNGVKTLEIER